MELKQASTDPIIIQLLFINFDFSLQKLSAIRNVSLFKNIIFPSNNFRKPIFCAQVDYQSSIPAVD